MRHRLLRRVIGAVAALFVLSGIVAVATGQLSYVTTRGISMLPKYRTGDVVILRRSGSYHVGEIVAYHSPLLHTVVLHRIVAERDGLFTFKGDNNSFVDPIQLPLSAIEGTDIVDLPHQFSFLTEDPAFVEVVLFLVFLLFLIGVVVVVGAPRARRSGVRGGIPARVGRPAGTSPGVGWLVVGFAGICVCGGLVVEGLATPGAHRVTETLPFSQEIRFSYSASAPRDVTYPSGQVATGMPVFLDLVKSVTVKASYTLGVGSSSDISGSITMSADVQESDGWSHVLAESPPVPFTGTQASATLTLPLAQALDLAHAASVETGVQQGGESVVVTPTVVTKGTVGGQPISGNSSPRLTFELNPLELNLLSGAPDGSPAQYPQLVSTDDGTVHRYGESGGAVAVLGVRMAPVSAMLVGLAGLVASAVCMALGLSAWRRRRTVSEDQRALRRVRHELVPVASDPAQSSSSVVDVATLAALVGLAERFDVGMLRYRYGTDEFYFVPIGEILYRCSGVPGDDATVVVADSVRRAERTVPNPSAPEAVGDVSTGTTVRSTARPTRRRATGHQAHTASAGDRAGSPNLAARSRRRRRGTADASKGRQARRRPLSLIPRPPELELYEELTTYGTPAAGVSNPGGGTFPLLRLRPRKLSGYGPPKHARGSGHRRKAS